VPKHIRHACRFLRGNEKIAGFLAAIERNAKLLDDIKGVLPPPLDKHCLHAVLEGSVLTLLTDSPVWSSRLRFFAPELERGLPRHYGAITGCRIRVQPPASSPPPAPESRTRPRLSPQAAIHLMEAAAGTDDQEIASALRRLAQAGAAKD
jgi:hypothetical protein